MTRRSTLLLESMLEDLYASVCEAGRFATFAAKLRKAMNAQLVALQTHDTGRRQRTIQTFHDDPVAPKAPLADSNRQVKLHFVRDAAHVVGCGVSDDAVVFAPDERQQTTSCRQQPIPVNSHWSIAFCLSSVTSGQATVLIVNRDKLHSPFEPEVMQLAQRLLPHLRNVYTLQQHLQPLAGVAAGWDFLRFGVWLLDRDGRVAHANTEALRLARIGTAGLSERDHVLIPNWRPDRPAFQQALATATHGDTGCDTELLLHDSSGRVWAACNIRPLHRDILGHQPFTTPCTAILFARPLVQFPTSAKTLRHVFGLTPAETDLACALLQHGALADCGTPLNRQRETLRTHLKGLFAKTETHRQSELIRRLQAAGD